MIETVCHLSLVPLNASCYRQVAALYSNLIHQVRKYHCMYFSAVLHFSSHFINTCLKIFPGNKLTYSLWLEED